jgi:hypothetical protein
VAHRSSSSAVLQVRTLLSLGADPQALSDEDQHAEGEEGSGGTTRRTAVSTARLRGDHDLLALLEGSY